MKRIGWILVLVFAGLIALSQLRSPRKAASSPTSQPQATFAASIECVNVAMLNAHLGDEKRQSNIKSAKISSKAALSAFWDQWEGFLVADELAFKTVEIAASVFAATRDKLPAAEVAAAERRFFDLRLELAETHKKTDAEWAVVRSSYDFFLHIALPRELPGREARKQLRKQLE